ncbi:Protein of unknown function DUF1446 [Rhodopseudomonas palustris HaA2]|uniref:Acyclic terpene utilisation N-terminal domain-containing protein n=1 Tax=Rhodopseudomonas palustris (strain HaA2) TaxID=316058 RepID=Q2J005_RHOP2|nr:acyclic terpene utilization AtuA family protein [Rhodopseudomonas palustris]ABD06205.1 Protein of unknown function DUF1446 [Rhodopseudomonas palustris HaA2]
MNTRETVERRVVRLGAGAGFARDHIEPALDLARDGKLDYLIFECLAERTIALAQQQKQTSPELGYDPMFEARMRAVLPIQREKGFRIVTNMGAVNPAAAGRLAQAIAGELNIAGLKIAVLEGDDVLAQVKGSSARFLESGEALDARSHEIIAANAYLGASGICAALDAGADIVICGRVSDPALFLGPLVHEFGWSMTDWNLMGRGTLIGHMLECAGQVSGGYFADPGYKDVENLGNLGFPIGEVDETGDLVISKLPGTGGCVTAATCKEQLLYEIHDPRAYYQPDVIADFSDVRIEVLGQDRVRLTGAKGSPRPATLKVSVAYRDGYIGEGQISYGGSGAVTRARLAGDIVRQRLARAGVAVDELKVDLIGIDSLHGQRLAGGIGDPYEVRLRVAARVATRTLAEAVAREVESLYTNGPAGGGGVVQLVREVIAVQSVLIPRDQTSPVVTMLEA